MSKNIKFMILALIERIKVGAIRCLYQGISPSTFTLLSITWKLFNQSDTETIQTWWIMVLTPRQQIEGQFHKSIIYSGPQQGYRLSKNRRGNVIHFQVAKDCNTPFPHMLYIVSAMSKELVTSVVCETHAHDILSNEAVFLKEISLEYLKSDSSNDFPFFTGRGGTHEWAGGFYNAKYPCLSSNQAMQTQSFGINISLSRAQHNVIDWWWVMFPYIDKWDKT